jgi:hypothetical protein
MRAAGYPLSLVCQTLGVSRAGFYKRQRAPGARAPRPRPDNEGVAQRIRTILDREETFGYRRVWAWLRFKEGGVVNRRCIGSCS